MSGRRETIRCVESGQPFGLLALWEGVRATPFFGALIVFAAFVTVLPGAGFSLAARVAGAITFLFIARLVVASWRNPIYRKLRWLGLFTLALVAGGVICAVTVSPAFGKSMLFAGVVLAGAQVPMYPKLRPVEAEGNASDSP